MTDPTQRFSSRVNDYIAYRPGYPAAILKLLAEECGMTHDSVVADVGSGTGIWSESLLENGARVFGVEPNREMREAGERLLRNHIRFTSIAATAEATRLADQSVDLVTVAQAFHWFNRERTRAEFVRILKPGGWVVLIWNDRRTDSTPFLRAYEGLLREFATDYAQVNHRHIDDAVIGGFFAPQPFRLRVFENRQSLDFDGAKGRLLSSSYTPEASHPKHEGMLRELKAIYDAHQRDGTVVFEYDTKVYLGNLS
jgi:SAM-dependent methyltransferase